MTIPQRLPTPDHPPVANTCPWCPAQLSPRDALLRHVLLRHQYAACDLALRVASGEQGRLTVAGLVLDLARQQASTVAGLPLRLTVTEYRLLRLLATQADTVVEHAELVDVLPTAFTTQADGSGARRVHMGRLRHKLMTALGASPIENVQGVGYILRTEPQP